MVGRQRVGWTALAADVLSTERLQAADVEVVESSWTMQGNAEDDSEVSEWSLMTTLDEYVEVLLITTVAVDDGAEDGPAWKGAVDANVDVQVFWPPCVHLMHTAFV